MKSNIINMLDWIKQHKKEIFLLKFIIIIIINIWLLLLFWRIIVLNGINIGNNNMFLTKMNNALQPILFVLGIDYLSLNTIKMIIISIIILGVNLSVIYFNQMILLLLAGCLARYSYKSYSNYLINNENINYLGFKNIEKQKVIEQIPEITTKVVENTTYISSWTPWIIGGLIVAVTICFGLAIYSHNQVTSKIVESNEIMQDTTININQQLNNVNSKTTSINKQIDLIMENHGKTLNKLNESDQILNDKIENLEHTVQQIGQDLVKVNELGNSNILKLSQRSFEISQEAADAMKDIAAASTTVEGVTLGLAKIYELLMNTEQKVELLETRVDSLTGAQTIRSPRSTVSIPSIIKKDEI